MKKSVRSIAHDLLPLSGSIIELSCIISEMLTTLEKYAVFPNPEIKHHFTECYMAFDKLSTAAALIKKYIQTIDDEG